MYWGFTWGSQILLNNQGNFAINGIPNTSYKLYVNGNAYATGAWGSSDKRWKKNITPLKDSLNKVLSLQGVNYDWRVEEFPSMNFTAGKQVGVIAQEVEQIIPEIVNTESAGYKAVAYDKITAVLIEALKELKLEKDSEIKAQQENFTETFKLQQQLLNELKEEIRLMKNAK